MGNWEWNRDALNANWIPEESGSIGIGDLSAASFLLLR